MVTLEFLREHIDFINLKNLCELAGMPYRTLNSKLYLDLKKPALSTDESLKFEQILREHGIVQRRTISGEELRNNPILKVGPLIKEAGLTSWAAQKISRGKPLKEDEKKALAAVITKIAKAF